MKKKHLAFTGRGKKDEEKIIHMLEYNDINFIKNSIINYIINTSELDLNLLQVCEGGVSMNNKELRFHISKLWEYDYKCIPLYNRNEDLFSKQELENIRDLIINYFDDSYNIKLKCKFVSLDDLTKRMFN